MNLGNTCFLNSLLQAVSPCSSIVTWLKQFVQRSRLQRDTSRSLAHNLKHSLEGRYTLKHSLEGRYTLKHSLEGRYTLKHSLEGRCIKNTTCG